MSRREEAHRRVGETRELLNVRQPPAIPIGHHPRDAMRLRRSPCELSCIRRSLPHQPGFPVEYGFAVEVRQDDEPRTGRWCGTGYRLIPRRRGVVRTHGGCLRFSGTCRQRHRSQDQESCCVTQSLSSHLFQRMSARCHRTYFCTAGRSKPMRTAIIAMTTRPAPANARSPMAIAIAVVSPRVWARIRTGCPTAKPPLAWVTTPFSAYWLSPRRNRVRSAESMLKWTFQSEYTGSWAVPNPVPVSRFTRRSNASFNSLARPGSARFQT